MIRTLHIENYALIQESDILFNDGFVAITGETGAGKSILLGALGLLLGQRADLQVLGNAERKCVVEAEWDIHELDLERFFLDNDLDYDPVSLLLRREILPTGKSRAFINDVPTQLSVLKDLGARLIDIHSQHQTLTLTDSQFQRALLDQLSDMPELIPQYTEAFHQYIQLKHQLETLVSQTNNARQNADYLQFQLQELDQAKLIEGEQEELEAEQILLSHSETLTETLTSILQISSLNDTAALPSLNLSHSQLSKILPYCPELEPLSERLNSSIIELTDIFADIEHFYSRLQFSPERLQQVSERLDLIYHLEQKHHLPDLPSLINFREDTRAKLTLIESNDDQIQAVMEQVDKAFQKVQLLAQKLTSSRKKSARLIEQQVRPILANVGMPHAQLQVSIVPAADYSPNGHDSIAFLFNANQGGTLRELSKVASGGELSRLMLAIKSLIINRGLLPTIIFDEIDTGISGDISAAVGDIMRAMSRSMQVITITHMPQIAAQASQHLKVYKQDASGATTSHIRPLSQEERETEIAVMLSTNPPTAAALQTARELLARE